MRAKVISNPEEWKWSSYRYTAGIKKAPDCLTTVWIVGHFGKNKTEVQKLYRKFVKEGIGANSPWRELQGQILLGEKTFIEKNIKFLHGKEQIKEIPRIQRYLNRPKLADLFCKGDMKKERDKNIYAAHVRYGYRLNEISEYLGIHYTTVSKVLKNAERN